MTIHDGDVMMNDEKWKKGLETLKNKNKKKKHVVHDNLYMITTSVPI